MGKGVQVTFVSIAPASDVASVSRDAPTDVAWVKRDPAVRPSYNAIWKRAKDRRTSRGSFIRDGRTSRGSYTRDRRGSRGSFILDGHSFRQDYG